MTFISYAQNFEDVMLWRALKHIENGFYIDVGAAWPDEHSVTKAFYEHGWNGINIEPNPEFINRYYDERPRDKNLNIALGEKAGEAEITFIPNTGLSSLNKSISKSHSNDGRKHTQAIVEIKTLAYICEEHCSGKDIHFLKVDVEGFEEQVLRGNNWLRFRPWLVVVESTLPLSQVENYKGWEPILIDANYSLAYADGLNRFYASKEHQELLTAFKFPPNVFDDFKLHPQQQAEEHARQANAEAQQAESQVIRTEERARQAENTLKAIYHSRSWRVTAPLRWAIKQITLLKQQGWLKRFKKLIKKIIQININYINSRPIFRKYLITTTKKLGLYIPFRNLYYRFSKDTQEISRDTLTAHARHIHTDLMTAITKNASKNN